MRSLLVLAGLVLCFVLTPVPTVRAQVPVAYPGAKVEVLTVVVPEAEVRSGPSPEFYVTSRLRAGNKVEVLRVSDKNPGWYEIHPPLGSFSWINGNFLTEMSNDKKTFVVTAAVETLVPVLAGSTEINKE